MTETRRRAKVADFTHAVIEDGFGLLMKNSKRDGPDLLKVFMPHHYTYVLFGCKGSLINFICEVSVEAGPHSGFP